MHTLILYHYDECPYCQRVRSAISALKLQGVVELRNTRQDRRFRDELVGLTGHTQVPCLVIDGKPMLESADIIRWLKQNYAGS